MWILLKKGQKHRPGDELSCGRGSWYVPCEETWRAWDSGSDTECARRWLEGWELVEYALADLGEKACETTPLFWKCDCGVDYIHCSSEADRCPICDAVDLFQPDARKSEVIQMIIDS